MLKSDSPQPETAGRNSVQQSGFTYRKPRGPLMAAAFLLLAALLLPVHWTNIDRYGYWEDEIYTARDIGLHHIGQSEPRFVLSFRELTYKNDNHPPLYFWMLTRWVSAFGFTESAGRGFSLFWLALTLLVMAAAVREWMPANSWWAGWWAVLFFGSSTYLYLMAREARMYTLVLFWISLSLLFFFRLVREARQDRPLRISSIVGFTLASTFGLYTHYYFAFLYVAFVVLAGCLWLSRRFSLTSLAFLTVPALLFAPWVPLLLRQRERKYQSGLWVMASEGGGTLEGLLSHSSAALSRILFGTVFETGKVAGLLALAAVLLLLLRKIRPAPRAVPGLLMLAVFSYLLLIANDLAHGTVTAGQPKYLFIFVLPLGAAFLLVALASLAPVRFILIVVLLGYNIVGIGRHWDFQPRPDWRAITRTVEERTAGLPLLVPDEDFWGCLSFYLQENERLLNEDWLSVYPEDFWYVVVYLPWNAKTQSRVADLESRFQEVERVTVDRFSMLVRYRVR
jgi:hypothetical protein